MSLSEEVLQQLHTLLQRKNIERVRLVIQLLRRQPSGELDSVLSSLRNDGKDAIVDAILAFQLNPYDHQWTTEYVTEVLSAGGVPFFPDAIERKDRLARIRSLLKDLSVTSYSMRVLLLHGAGGLGKTTLAAGAVRDSKLLVDCFHDGVLWVSTGSMKRLSGQQLASSITRLLETILKHPLLERGGSNDSDTTRWPADWVKSQLKSQLSCKRLLLVLDDVCSQQVLAAFEALPIVILVTSRRRDVTDSLLVDGRFIEVAACSDPEALHLVRSLGRTQSDAALEATLQQSHGNPLLLSIMAPLFETRSVEKCLVQSELLPSHLQRLSADCLTLVPALYATVQDATVTCKGQRDPITCEGQRDLIELYLDLSAMRDGEALVPSHVTHLWQVSLETTMAILDEFAERNVLVTSPDGSFRLHDVLLDVIRDVVEREEGSLDERHRRWIQSYVLQHGARGVIEGVEMAVRMDSSSSDARSVEVDRVLYHVECLQHPHELSSMLVDGRPRWTRFLESLIASDHGNGRHVVHFTRRLSSLAILHSEQLDYRETIFFQLVSDVAESILSRCWDDCLNRFLKALRNSSFSEEQQRVLRLFVDIADQSTESTPLHWVAAAGDYNSAMLLTTLRADVNAKNVDGKTPLHYAAWGGHLPVVKALLASHADVDATDHWDEITPLHLAADSGHKETAEVLLAHGAYVNAVDRDKRTPMRLALQRGHGNVTEMLSTHGAV